MQIKTKYDIGDKVFIKNKYLPMEIIGIVISIRKDDAGSIVINELYSFNNGDLVNLSLIEGKLQNEED